MSDEPQFDFDWCWAILCAEFRPAPAVDALQLEPGQADTPAEQPVTDGVDDAR